VTTTKEEVIKAERMPETQLLDRLFVLFAEQEVISQKDLMLRTNQPQAWLREVLLKIAEPSKDGYRLRPEFKVEAQRGNK